mmetsp:Transcript_20431/g.33367  ORF Transcript_20431/g.33367 Transcript_20431/m.33367 type:complete len:88 (-) Transcript_20431:203-466(-)
MSLMQQEFHDSLLLLLRPLVLLSEGGSATTRSNPVEHLAMPTLSTPIPNVPVFFLLVLFADGGPAPSDSPEYNSPPIPPTMLPRSNG